MFFLPFVFFNKKTTIVFFKSVAFKAAVHPEIAIWSLFTCIVSKHRWNCHFNEYLFH